MASLIGKEIGKYRITERLGQGGMAEVYLGIHTHLDRKVAVKVLHSHLLEGGDFVARFKREAKAVANLRHPNIIQVHDFDVQEDLIFMVMEYIDGTNLHARLAEVGNRGEKLPIKLIGSIINDISSALDYAHSKGMLHRDIKPSNILIDQDDKAYLVDFGIAKLLSDQKFTATGTLVGTPAYMSPEQGRGDELTEESDIYSLGIVAFEMLTGQVPYDARTPIGIVHKQINDPVPNISELVDGVPGTAQAVINRALAKSPEGRYSSAEALTTALRIALEALESTDPISEEAQDDHLTLIDDGLESPTVTMKAEDMEQATVVMATKAKKEEPAKEDPPEKKAKEKPAPKPKGEKKKIPLWATITGAVAVLAVIGVILTQMIDFGGKKPTISTSTILSEEVELTTTTSSSSDDDTTTASSSSSGDEVNTESGHPTTPVTIFFDLDNQDGGLGLVKGGDHDYEVLEINSVQVFRSGFGEPLPADNRNETGDYYLKFAIDDEILFDLPPDSHVRIEVEYLDQASEFDLTNHWFVLEYDAHSGGGSGDGTFKSTDFIVLNDNGEFRNIVFDLDGARFANRTQGSDFRFHAGDGTITLRSVTVFYFPPGVNPDAPWVNGEELFHQGEELQRQGNNLDAIDLFDQALGAGYDTAELRAHLGTARRELGDPLGAIEDLKIATEMDPDNIMAFISLAEAYFNTGDDQYKNQAHATLDRALELNPRDPAVHWLLGEVRYFWFGIVDEAIQDFTRAMELNPGESHYYKRRGLVYLETGQWELCVADYEEFIALDPENPSGYFGGALCSRELGEMDITREYFEQFLEISQGDPDLADPREEAQKWLDEN